MKSRLLTPALVAAGVALALGGTTAIATHDPSNKPAASGSTAELAFVGENEEKLVLQERIKTANPTDLILQLTSECSIMTSLATTGNESSQSVGQLKYRIEIDGRPVSVMSGDQDGEVVFCDRAHRQSITNLDDEDARIEQFMRTRTANGFNWMALNVGSGIHDIKVFARFDRETEEGLVPSGENDSTGAVGARTLVIEPVHASNDEVVAPTSERNDDADNGGTAILPIGG